MKFFDPTVLAKALRGINRLRLTAQNIEGYRGFVPKFATLQKYQTDPIGTIHTIRTLEKIGLDNVLQFERKMEQVFPDIPPIKTATGANGVKKNRRADVWVKENTNIELKGSVADPEQPFKMNNSADLEFLNDAIYFSRAGQKFEWHIAKQLDIGPAKERMKELLDDGNIPDGVDKRLFAYISELAEASPGQAATMINNFKTLFDELDAGNIIKNAEYLD